MHDVIAAELGTSKEDGYGFHHKESLKPLQAADILAWQMKTHLERIMPFGEDRKELTHPGFMLLREDQVMDLNFFTPRQLEHNIKVYEKAISKGLRVVD